MNDFQKSPRSFQGLQGLAAIYVFAYNYGTYGSSDVIERIANNGRVCVSIFFVISGFIMVCMNGHCEMKSESSCRMAFWLKRWFRLMPAYLFALALNVSDIRSMWEDESQFESRAAKARAWTGIIGHIIGVSTWFPFSSIVWNPVSWYVQTELCFYLLFPRLLKMHRRFMARRGWRGWVELMIFYTTFGWVITMIIALASEGLDPVATELNHLPWIRFPEFAIGMLFGTLHKVKSITMAAAAARSDIMDRSDDIIEIVESKEEEEEESDEEEKSISPATALEMVAREATRIAESISPLAEAFADFAEKRCDILVVLISLLILATGMSNVASDWCAFGVFAFLIGVCLYALAANESSTDEQVSKIVGRFLSTRILQNMGELSYCFYLVHFSWPSVLISLGYHLPPSQLAAAESADSLDPLAYESPNLAWPYFLISIGTSFLMHEMIEAPIYVAACKWLHKKSVVCDCTHPQLLPATAGRRRSMIVSPVLVEAATPPAASEWELELLIEDQRLPSPRSD